MTRDLFEQFAENLYRESPRGAYALESMKFGIMARTGLNERDALELACRIVLADPKHKQEQKPMAEKKKREPMNRQEAADIFDAAIRRHMAEHRVDYPTAFRALQSEKPGVVEGYSAVTRREQFKAIQSGG